MPQSLYPNWKWDQGHLEYFQFENVSRISRVLASLDGAHLAVVAGVDPLRDALSRGTGLSFRAPASYTVWRNYKRTFELLLLATKIDDRLRVSDICRKLASDDGLDADEYFSLLIPRLKFPFFGFEDYSAESVPVFPMIAILKYLISKRSLGQEPSVTVEDIFAVLVANRVTGTEPGEQYANLERRTHDTTDSEIRQVREMLIAFSCMSIFKWNDGKFYLDVTDTDLIEHRGFEYLVVPTSPLSKAMREEEFYAITSLSERDLIASTLQPRENPTDDAFVEGKRSRVTHLKIERSPLLRKMFLQRNSSAVCDMCTSDMRRRYNWTTNLLEIHHVLPLSSSVAVTVQGTSLDDVVGVCPNCHRAVHAYYRHWFHRQGQNDFRTKGEAREVYSLAKTAIIL